MATIPDWKLQLLARRRQEEAVVRGREKAERERLSQMPAWKRGILERRRAKLGLSPGEPSPVPGTAEAGPPDPDEPAVLLEAIGPVHQNRFIRQERQQQQQQQQRNEEMFLDRKPGSLEARERRPNPGEMRDQSPKGRESREDRPNPWEAREKRLGTGVAQESSPRTLEPRDLRQSPGDAGDRNSRLPEVQKWRLSPGETQERSLRLTEAQEPSPGRKEVVENRLSPGEANNLAEASTRRLDAGEPQELNVGSLDAPEWRPSSGEEKRGCTEPAGRERPVAGTTPEEPAALSPVPVRVVEAAEWKPSLVEDGERGLRPPEGCKWTLNSGKARERTLKDIETQSPKSEAAMESVAKHLGPAGRVGAGGAEAEDEEAGAQGRPGRALQNLCSAPAPVPPGDAGTAGPRPQEEEAAGLRPPAATPLSPPPPAPAAPQPPGDPLMSRLFYGVKPGPGVGAPRRSGHTFTVNPRRSQPPAAAAPAAPAAPATTEAAAPGAGKKRYPTAEEILVLGGYLRLSRSCLAKGSPERHHKQLKISFSETALETTYQYPSESSVLEELGPEPEAPSAPTAAPVDDEEDEEELLLLQPGLRTKALIVDESCRR